MDPLFIPVCADCSSARPCAPVDGIPGLGGMGGLSCAAGLSLAAPGLISENCFARQVYASESVDFGDLDHNLIADLDHILHLAT